MHLQQFPQIFPQFSLLPIELRFCIYILATQPRFINIRERPSEYYEEFEERFASEAPFNNPNFHPSLAHFSHEWRHTIPHKIVKHKNLTNYIPSSSTPHQSLLTSHAFTTTKPLPQPWPPSSKCPEIPLHTLHERPDIVWALTRSSYLSSSAPIPSFLHVSRESRSCLMKYGYELAFITRTCGPRTWVCWKDDVVYLMRIEEEKEGGKVGSLMLSREPWGLGVFMPCDLQKMRRIALKKIYFGVEEAGSVSKILRLCGGLEELFIVEQNLGDLFEDEEDGYLGWVDCDEADALHGCEPPWPSPWCELSLGCVGHDRWGGYDCFGLVKYKREHGGDSSGFFADLCRRFEDSLRNEMRMAVAMEGVAPWRIPSARLVLVGTMRRMKRLFEMRDRYWRAAKEKELKELEGGVPFAERVPGQRPLSPWSLAWKDDMEAYEETISYY